MKEQPPFSFGSPQYSAVENHLRERRQERGFSQNELAQRIGITRQAIYAIEGNRYLPSTEVALKLAHVLQCTVEDLFRIAPTEEIIEADLVGQPPQSLSRVRAKVGWVGERIVATPVSTLGDVLNYVVAADGLILGHLNRKEKRLAQQRDRICVQLLRERRTIKDQILVAGCDPAIFLAGEHFRRCHGQASVVGLTMGSGLALQALKRGEVHAAGIHILDHRSGEPNLPYLRKHFKDEKLTVVRFATWEQGLMVQAGNPKKIKKISDLTRRGMKIVNREKGAGARMLLDYLLGLDHIPVQALAGYELIVPSHLEVARIVAERRADAGIGVKAAASLFGLEFIPLQEEQYDLVIPTKYLKIHPSISDFLDTIVTQPFRTEIEALGGYDTRETGKIIN